MGRLIGGLLFVCLLAIGCRKADRYVSKKKPPAPDSQAKTEALNPNWSWLPTETHDIPIVFVPPTAKEWGALPSFWNVFPDRASGMRTVHIGQDPIGAAVAMTAAFQLEVVKIKVPLGLPDPTPHIPPSNPPTLAKWQLGKDLFFASILADGKLACSECHRPSEGFAWVTPVKATRNPLSLINCVYNSHQFWDGRVRSLEEVVVRSLEDERPPAKDDLAPQRTHVWSGLVKSLAADPHFQFRFKEVFSIEQPTQDAAAKALATYMRTILSGNSLYDRAEADRAKKGSPDLAALHFQGFLDEKAMYGLGTSKEKPADTARSLEKGTQLFFSGAACSRCHSGPLFRDGDFHNTGLSPLGGDSGRIAAAPIGLKETRFDGAFRTPSLRALPRTAPYFHDGKGYDLKAVLAYYNSEIFKFSPNLAKELRDPGNPLFARLLNLSDEDLRALELFLRSLDGDPVDPIVASAPPKVKKQ